MSVRSHVWHVGCYEGESSCETQAKCSNDPHPVSDSRHEKFSPNLPQEKRKRNCDMYLWNEGLVVGGIMMLCLSWDILSVPTWEQSNWSCNQRWMTDVLLRKFRQSTRSSRGHGLMRVLCTPDLRSASGFRSCAASRTLINLPTRWCLQQGVCRITAMC